MPGDDPGGGTPPASCSDLYWLAVQAADDILEQAYLTCGNDETCRNNAVAAHYAAVTLAYNNYVACINHPG